MTELTKLYPMVQIKKNTWEIDEFDCASIFLLIGTEKAMVIDCGMGIGDLRGAIEMITDKPLICVISHGHIDHTANARQFGEIWLNPKDQGIEIPMNYARRRYDTEHIAQLRKEALVRRIICIVCTPTILRSICASPAPVNPCRSSTI